MANVFSGTVLDQKGKPIQQAQIKIVQDGVVYTGVGPDPSMIGSWTNERGEFRIQINEPIDPRKITLTVTKDKKEIRSITNPAPTSIITTANLQIRKELGGELTLKGKYKGGEYYFESLGGKGASGDLVRDEFDLNMLELEGLIKNCSEKNIPLDIIITGSESRIPNTDNEPFLPDGKTSNPNNGKPLLEDKELARRRVEYLNKHITEDLFTLDNRVYVRIFNITKQETLQVNGPPYPGSADYTQYQYVSISAKPRKPLCSPVYLSPSPGEIKDVSYVAPGSNFCAFNAFRIPDRFGFNGYLSPHYTFWSPQTVTGNNTDTYLKSWGLMIYMYLYLSNNKNTAFLDVTTPGLALNYKVLEKKKLYIEATDAERKTYNETSLLYATEQLKKALNPASKDIYGNELVQIAFNRLLTDYPNEFTLPRQGEGNTINRVPVTPSDSYNNKMAAVNEFFDNLIKDNVKIATIEVKHENQYIIDITKPEYRLTPNGLGNQVIGISGSPIPLQSVWAYIICGERNFPWITGTTGGGAG